MQTLTLQLTVDEINLILTSLGNMPYSQVFQLIQKMDAQASAQLSQGSSMHSSSPSQD